MYQGLLTTNPGIKGWAYEYADGMNIGLQTYEDLGIPVKNLTVALRTDEQDLFCDWADRNEPTYNILYSAGGNFQSRVGVTAAMMSLQGAEIPAEVVGATRDAAGDGRATAIPIVSLRPFPVPRWCRTRSCS